MILFVGPSPAVQRTMIFDRFTPGAVNRAAVTREHASGKSINAARVAHTLGASVVACGFLGGARGRFCCDDLSHSGIAADFVQVEGETRVCTTVIDRTAHQQSELIEESAAVGPEAGERLFKTIERHLPESHIMVLSGTVPGGIANDFFARCCGLARRTGVQTIIDAHGEPLRLALKSGVTLVKPNIAELAGTLCRTIESPADIAAAMAELIAMGARSVIVTRGSQSVFLAGDAGAFEIRLPRVEVANAIGSGDAFAGALAAGLDRGDAVPEACRFAAAAASAHAASLFSGFLEPAAVNRLLADTSLMARPDFA